MSHDIERPNKVQSVKSSIETPSAEELRSAVHPEKKSIFDRLGRGGQVAVMVALAGSLAGAGFGVTKALSGESNNAPELNPEPSVEAPLVPGEPEPTEVAPVETEAPVEIAPETLRLSADLPAEELAKASVELVNDWMFAGATDDTIKATSEEQMRLIQEEGLGRDEAFVYMAEENADYYSKAILVDNWQNNPEAVEFRQYLVDQNARVLQSALTRYTNNEPLITWSFEVSEVEELVLTDSERQIQYVTTLTAHNDTSAPDPVRIMNVRNFDITTGSALISDESSGQLDGFN